MACLRQLADPSAYVACAWDLSKDDAGRAVWHDVFTRQVESVVAHARESYAALEPSVFERFRCAYLPELDRILNEPEAFGRVTILTFDHMRQTHLNRFGFPDAYAALKTRENDRSLAMLRSLVRAHDDATPTERLDMLARGLMAGNIFDVGSEEALVRHEEHAGDLLASFASLPKRPWFRDGFGAFADVVRAGDVGHLAVFVDNAGPDIVLGVLPLVRWLLESVDRCTLLANETPALNDVTAEELTGLLDVLSCGSALASDDVLTSAWRTGRLRVCSTGTGEPLIDLTTLSESCVAAIADADVLWLHGMGRALESNWTAKFLCPVLHTAVVKDRGVAAFFGAEMFDCIVDWRPRHGG